MRALLASTTRRAGVAALALLGGVAGTMLTLPASSAISVSVAASSTVSPAPSPPACNALLFKGNWYCSATIAGIQATSYGTGKRMVLRQVTVTDASTVGKVTVAAWANLCPPGKYCGASMTLQSLTLPWTTTLARPKYGDILDVFGTTTTGSLRVVGFVTTGNCPIDWC